MRPIPYQVTAAGDVILDFALANDMIPKSEVTFRCELHKIVHMDYFAHVAYSYRVSNV